MPKRKISKQQLARIQKLQDRRRSQVTHFNHIPLGTEQIGLLVVHYGKYADVEKEKQTYRCYFRQNLGTVVVGDNVVFCLSENNQGIIVAVEPRQSLLFRLNEKNEKKPVAANIDQIMITIASIPEPSTLLLDSYLVAAEILNIQPIILFNKMDLATTANYQKLIILYQQLGYQMIHTSRFSAQGLILLRKSLCHHTSVFVGQSGAGKSSLIQALLPHEEIPIGNLHEASGLGTHTTTAAKLYHLPHGGNLIDSPGIRSFVLWPMSSLELSQGFIEFRSYAGHCKFRNCTHLREPGCVIVAKVNEGKIHPSRWGNYKKLLGAVDN